MLHLLVSVLYVTLPSDQTSLFSKDVWQNGHIERDGHPHSFAVVSEHHVRAVNEIRRWLLSTCVDGRTVDSTTFDEKSRQQCPEFGVTLFYDKSIYTLILGKTYIYTPSKF